MFTPKEVSNDFVQVVPEEGLNACCVGLLVYLGEHKKLPRFAKDGQGNIELDNDGKKKIIFPKVKDGKEETVKKVGVYVDLLDQTHDYGDEIGVKNIRLPLHKSLFGVSEGINYVPVAPRDTNGNYIKGKAWTLAPASIWQKLAAVTKTAEGKTVKDIIFEPSYKNPNLNNIGLLLGKPFMVNVEVKTSEKQGKTFYNTSVKSPVPLMKNLTPKEPLIWSVSVGFHDKDLLDKKDELGGACKFDLIRMSDLRKIVLAEDYEGSEIQKAVQSKMNEKELIEKAKEYHAKQIAADKDLQEVMEEIAKRNGGASTSESAAPVAPATTVQQEQSVVADYDDDDLPF